MGKMHKPMFEAAGHEVIISSVRKVKPGVVDAIEATKRSDVTIISVPIRNTEEVIWKVAPYCAGALMDFTGIKTKPLIHMMLAGEKAREVGGLHPLYGEVPSIKGEGVVYCPTRTSKHACNKVIEAFGKAGAKVTIMKAEEHDLAMHVVQNERITALQGLMKRIRESKLRIETLYDISPPPTRVMIDLLARQIHPKNDELYEDMLQFNPNSVGYEPKSYIRFAREAREFLGQEFLAKAQERAANLMKHHKQLCYP
jgi:prephenate dehydrogenase